MPVLFGSLAAVLLAFAAWLGYKNQSELENQILDTQSELATKDGLGKDFKSATDLLDKTIAKKLELKAENKEKVSEQTKLQEKLDELKDDVEAKKAKLQQLEQDVSDNEERVKEFGKIDELVDQIKKTKKNIAVLKEEIETSEAELSNLNQIKTDTDAAIAKNKVRRSNETQGRSQPTLNTSIRAAYNDWGFVILNGGDIQGVVPSSTLDVHRGGEVIAKLRVSSVEPNKASADIIRDSVKADTILQPGDVVKAESKEENAAAAN